VRRRTGCPVMGNTCDDMRTPYERLREFLDLPAPAFLPRTYRAASGSSIRHMGLHLLDSRFTYTVPYLDVNPVLLYGSFAGQVLFAETAVTLQTLQAIAPGEAVSFAFRQPRVVRGDVPWPTRFAIRRLASGGFRVAFTGLRRIR
jgi:hypothetical protein